MSWVLRVTLLCVVAAGALLQAEPQASTGQPETHWTTTIQSGLMDSFQLTLGGTFGQGPAWQSRLDSGLTNVWKAGDSLSVFGIESLDLGGKRSDWQAGIDYRTRLWTKGRHVLSGTVGWWHWKFGNVKTGANDWLTHENLTYRRTGRKLALTATSDSWSLLTSPLPTGARLHTQVWMEHPVSRREPFLVSFRHGPAHTYSWGTYGTEGHRVVRYQTMLSVVTAGTRFEVGYRKQLGLRPGIPDNSFWQFSVSRTFTHR